MTVTVPVPAGSGQRQGWEPASGGWVRRIMIGSRHHRDRARLSGPAPGGGAAARLTVLSRSLRLARRRRIGRPGGV